MLKDNFYNITTISISEQKDSFTKIIAKIAINSRHPIFSGHFPGNPVVPGVCLIQMVRETVELHSNLKITLLKSSTIKFLSILRPEADSFSELELSVMMRKVAQIGISAVVTQNQHICMKFDGTYLER
jgi:3-hydroxyacyl-[acyl-carrier-protein] dehydratase